jgi:hypothetical protein
MEGGADTLKASIAVQSDDYPEAQSLPQWLPRSPVSLEPFS